MRVLAGKYKGRRLISGQDLSIRPLTNRLKENIFNILQDFVDGAWTLDLFCGSGSFGIEALSRGARHIDFVDQTDHALKFLKKNITSLNITREHYEIFQADALRFCRQRKTDYDLILMDPPFKFEFLQQLTDLIGSGGMLKSDGLVILHHEITNPIATTSSDYELIDQRRYGRSLISFIKHGAKHV